MKFSPSVILSAASTSQREVPAESKDPYQRISAGCYVFFLSPVMVL